MNMYLYICVYIYTYIQSVHVKQEETNMDKQKVSTHYINKSGIAKQEGETKKE